MQRLHFGFIPVFTCAIALFLAAAPAHAAPCMTVTLTGTQGGPAAYNGLAGAGTLVRYGDDADDCNAVRLQFDAGRGTTMRLAQLGITPGQLDALFFTHVHSDHSEGMADLLQLRWHFEYARPKLDIVCAADAPAPQGHVMSCARLLAASGGDQIASGEIAQRRSEDPARPAAGPPAVARLIHFTPADAPQVVWSSGAVRVSAVRSTHIAGHASYRVDTPAGSVVIGGDAGNDVLAPPRPSSTSAQVEALARGADVLVHSAIHPVMGPQGGSGFAAPNYYRQSAAPDLGALAQRAGVKTLMVTHMIPALNADRQGPYKIPGGPLGAAAWREAVAGAGGGNYGGNIVIGTDLASVRVPAR
jgi:ribonuclease Z